MRPTWNILQNVFRIDPDWGEFLFLLNYSFSVKSGSLVCKSDLHILSSTIRRNRQKFNCGKPSVFLLFSGRTYICRSNKSNERETERKNKIGCFDLGRVTHLKMSVGIYLRLWLDHWRYLFFFLFLSVCLNDVTVFLRNYKSPAGRKSSWILPGGGNESPWEREERERGGWRVGGERWSTSSCPKLKNMKWHFVGSLLEFIVK